MSPQAKQKQAMIIVGAVAIGGSILLLLLGFMRLQSMQSQLARTFGGSDELGFGLLGFGAIALLGGIVLLALGLMAAPSITAHPSLAHSFPPPVALPPASTIPNHIYHYNTSSGLSGPFTLDDIRGLFAARVLSPATYVYRAGDSQWRLLASFPEITNDRNG